MKKLFSTIAVVVLVVLLLAVFPVQAQGVTPPTFDSILARIMELVIGFASLTGTSGLVAALINLGKWVGLVKDGSAAVFAGIFNVIGFIVLVALRVFRPDIGLDLLDGYAGQFAAVILFILGFLVQITTSLPWHNALSAASIPVIGKSFSGKQG